MHRWFGTSAQKAWVHPSLKVSELKRANILLVLCASHCEAWEITEEISCLDCVLPLCPPWTATQADKPSQREQLTNSNESTPA